MRPTSHHPILTIQGTLPKGGVENFNGLVRQYFPKGCDMRLITREALAAAEKELNNRPRKTLNYRRPIDHEHKFAA
jgi:IS30 family transposase